MPNREIELKIQLSKAQFAAFELHGALTGCVGTMEALLGIANRSTVQPSSYFTRDEYYDFPDRHLFSTGQSLRCRLVAAVHEVVLKSRVQRFSGIFSRTETSVVAPCGEGWPQEIVREMAQMAPGHGMDALRLQCVLECKRIVMEFDDGAGPLSVSLDRYQAFAGTRVSEEMYELEVEALSDDAAERLPSLSTTLTRAIGGEASAGSKYQTCMQRLEGCAPAHAG